MTVSGLALLVAVTGISPALAPLSGTAPPAVAVPPSASVPIDPSGTNVSVPAANGVPATVVFPACDGAPGTTVTIRALAPSSVAPGPEGGTILAAHAISFDRDLTCRALPSLYYALPIDDRNRPLVVEVRDGTGAPLGAIEQYRFGATAFEGGMFPSTAALTETRFTAGTSYVVALRAGGSDMAAEPVTFAPTSLALSSVSGIRLRLDLPAAISGGGRIVVRASDRPPAGVPPLVTTAGVPAPAYLSAVLIGNAVFSGEGRLIAAPLAGGGPAFGLALYDAERWTAGWTSAPVSQQRDGDGRTILGMAVPERKAFLKRVVLAIYPLPARRQHGEAGFSSLAFVPSAKRPLVVIVGDSTAVITIVRPSALGCRLDFAPEPACQATSDPELAFPGRLASLTGAQVVQLAWLGTSVADLPESDSELQWQVPQIPTDATAIVFAGGTEDVVLDPAADLQPRLDAIVAAMRARAPRARLVLVGIRYFNATQTDPVRRRDIDRWDERERQLAAEYGGAFVDLRTLLPAGISDAFPDGAHPSREAATAIAAEVARDLGAMRDP